MDRLVSFHLLFTHMGLEKIIGLSNNCFPACWRLSRLALLSQEIRRENELPDRLEVNNKHIFDQFRPSFLNIYLTS